VGEQVSGEIAREKRQQRVEELCAASIRALAAQSDLHFRGGRLHLGLRKLPAFAPHLHPTLDEDDFASFRGAADGLALRLAHSDPGTHALHCPPDSTARMLFELLEQIRVESLASTQMPGVQHNLQHRFDAWSLAFHASGLIETLSGLILYTVAQIARARVHGVPVLEATEDLIETTRGKLVRTLGPDLAALRRTREDQAAYAVHAAAIAGQISALLQREAEALGEDEAAAAEQAGANFSLWMDFDDTEESATPAATTERSAALDSAQDGYRIFTAAYDQEHRSEDLVRSELLREYREQLDLQIAQRSLNIARLSRHLKALLAEPTAEGWDGAQEQGRIDGARLAQLISSPAERRLFRDDRIEPVAQCALSFLIDCSGSMKQHASAVAMLVDVMARALEAAGVTSEILGFTTGAWNGGRAQRDWQRAGLPPHPGRLNERCHLVFKSAETTWRRARPAIAALLKADLFREGIDGEAVDWACGRLHDRPEERRILIVISDGCPMDSATQRANDATYLDQHLLQVVQRHEQAGAVEIFGVGVGLDLSVFHIRCQAIDLSQGLTEEVLREIVRLIAGTAHR
jgi:cobaltochelatase CobT